MFAYYAQKHKTLIEQAAQERDVLAWQTGLYVLQAVAVNFNGAFGKKGAAKIKYPEVPMYVEEHNEQLKAKKQEREVARSYANFIAAAQRMGKLTNEAAS